MPNTVVPADTLVQIPQELDHPQWIRQVDHTDIQVYTREGAGQSKVIGFKTVTYHTTIAVVLFEFLKDVCHAMKSINDQYVLGEIIESWSTNEDPKGILVRTSFSMPFPFTKREFLHGLHTYQQDAHTFIIGYTPAHERAIPVQDGYVRCPTYVSGQRITQLDNGMTRVEHLMTYRLGGKISNKMQDRWLKKAHVGAYVKEWRSLHAYHYPCSIEAIHYDQLKCLLLHALAESAQWDLTKKIAAGEIRVGRLPYCPKNIYRTDAWVNAPLKQVVQVIADKSLEFLPQWNQEFMSGEVLEVLENTPQKSVWIIRVHYQTPFFLSNREYIYFFSKEWLSSTEVLVTYHSIRSDHPIPQGFARALLHPSVHRCIELPDGRTKIEHLLATDLGGRLSAQQDSLLRGSLIQAHCRDLTNQQALFDQLNE